MEGGSYTTKTKKACGFQESTGLVREEFVHSNFKKTILQIFSPALLKFLIDLYNI